MSIPSNASGPDATSCPLCGGPNGCAIALDLPTTCWCFSTSVSRDALERVPVEMQGQVCVCRDCATDRAQPRE